MTSILFRGRYVPKIRVIQAAAKRLRFVASLSFNAKGGNRREKVWVLPSFKLRLYGGNLRGLINANYWRFSPLYYGRKQDGECAVIVLNTQGGLTPPGFPCINGVKLMRVPVLVWVH